MNVIIGDIGNTTTKICLVKSKNYLMKFEILKFKSVTSTNDVAVNLIKEKKN